MQLYCDKIFPGFWKYFVVNRNPYNNFLKRLFDFYIFSNYLIDNGLFNKITPEESPLQLLYAKGGINFYSIHNCLASGCISEACILMRCLFETRIILKLILQDNIEERLKLYSNYMFISKWLQVSNNTTDFLYSEINESYINYRRVKEDYHPKYPKNWWWKIVHDKQHDNPGLKYVCKYLHLENDYNEIYNTLSIFVHTDPHIVNHYNVNGKTIFIPYFSKQIYHIGYLSAFYLDDIIADIVKYFNNEIYPDIIIYTSLFLVDLNENYYKKSLLEDAR